MSVKELLALVSSKNPPQIRTDSRLVKDGDVFVAVKGTVYDGHDFIDQALANGAKYIVCQPGPPGGNREDAQVTIVDDSAEVVGLLAQASRGNPTSRLTNLAVTGTNGKTTVAYLVRSCIQNAGEKCGLIGTVIYDTCSGSGCEATMTTPDCLAVAEMTDEMVRNGAKYMVIEASSHALSQNRLAGVNFKAAAFTNLAGDHLDYHKTKEDYLAAKTELFKALSPDAVAVLNKQSPEAELIARQTQAKILWYAIASTACRRKPAVGANIAAYVESMDISGTVFIMEYAGQRQKVNTSLLGLYNVSNSLAAAGLCLVAGFDLQTIAAGLSALQTIPGRLEKIDGGDSCVIIDYAHTDDALKNVLATLKPLCNAAVTETEPNARAWPGSLNN
jgi:UDP-N-acetylmuramoyl-L-alanyl-D-glutamate--2,6-diaminopimelate ligase